MKMSIAEIFKHLVEAIRLDEMKGLRLTFLNPAYKEADSILIDLKNEMSKSRNPMPDDRSLTIEEN